MPSLSIPERFHLALKQIVNLSDEEFSKFVDALDNAPTSSAPEEIAKGLAAFSTAPLNEPLPMVEAIFNLNRVRADLEVPVDRFVSDLVPALKKLDSSILGGKEAAVRRRFTTLLQIEPISIGAKAANLRSEYEDLYCSAKVLTDLRPVWRQSEPDAPPLGAIATHVLKIEYHHGSHHRDHRQLYVALDAADIADLINVLQRAQKKESSIKNLMNRTNISDLVG